MPWFLPESDVAYWRNGWDNTVVPRSPVGASLLTSAAESYQKGLEDGASQKPTQEFCRRRLDGWSSDMTAANETGPRRTRDAARTGLSGWQIALGIASEGRAPDWTSIA